MHWHIDQTVGIWSRNTFTAHELDVWYASVPADMAGGELEHAGGNTKRLTR